MGSEHWYWLAAGLGWGAVNTGDLLAAFPGGAEEIAADLGSEKLDELVTQKQADRLTQSRPADFALRVGHAEAQGITTLGYDDEDYPAALRSIYNPPPVLFVKGDASLLNGQLAIGMVGTRRPSAYGAEAVKAIGRGVALGGAIIVSGLAAGLDAEAHKAALAVNGPTIACIAFGHDHCYPAANRKLMEVIERYGAVVSEYPLGTSPEKPYFLQRNRLIAGISHGLCVVEARRHSGTMSTANFASDFGRDVFAVPGSIFSELSGGTNAMIREGAYLAGSASDILSVYGIELSEEDPVETAAKQAQEGRPSPAGAAPPWQQSLRRYTERAQQDRREARPEELPGQQSLGEVLRGHLGNTGDAPVSAAAAVDAFRAIQKSMPPTDDSEIDARNAALDAMVDAVNDSVELSARSAAPARDAASGRAAPKKPAKGEPQLFPWDKVERLDKNEVEDLSPARQAKRTNRDGKSPVASRILDAGAKQKPKPATQRQAATASPEVYGAAGALEPIGAVEPVSMAVPAAQVEALEKPTPQQAPERQPVSTPAPLPKEPAVIMDIKKPLRRASEEPAVRQTLPPTPEAARPAPAASADTALQERLKTLRQTQRAIGGLPQKPPPPKPPLQKIPLTKPPRILGEEGASGPPPAAFVPQNTILQAAVAEREKELADPKELLSDVAKRAYGQLGAKPMNLSAICEKSGLSSAEAMAALTELELAGLSRQLPGRQFVIMQ